MRRVFPLIVLGVLLGCATTEGLSEGTVEYAVSPHFKVNRLYTLAVVPTVGADTTDSTVSSVVSEVSDKAHSILLSELMKVPTFDLVERKDIGDVLKELEFSHSPYAMREKAPKLGRMLGAELVAYFQILSVERVVYPLGETEVGWTYRITGSLKIVSVETGRLLYQATATASGTDPTEVVGEVIRRCVKPLRTHGM